MTRTWLVTTNKCSFKVFASCEDRARMIAFAQLDDDEHILIVKLV